jgi:hypothetical protein
MPGSPECNKPNQEWRATTRPQPEQQANPLVAFLREQRGEGERSHEEIVAIIRRQLEAHIEKEKPYDVDPVQWMRERFVSAHRDLVRAEYPELVGAALYERPYAQLLMAWDLISYPYYKSAHLRGLMESGVKRDAIHLGHTITLTANEGKLLSAMAEAVGIPNPFGQLTQKKKG